MPYYSLFPHKKDHGNYPGLSLGPSKGVDKRSWREFQLLEVLKTLRWL